MQTASKCIEPSMLQNIKHPMWLNLVRRCQQIAMTQQGLAILTFTVLVNADGEPIGYSTPKMTCIEPKGAMQQFLDTFTS